MESADWRLVSAEFFNRSPAQVARELLGAKLVRLSENQLLSGRIVETEAYLAVDDPASHSFIGYRPRNRWMFGEPGTLYVYTIHNRFCLNGVTEAAGIGSAVLIRALEPLNGIELMKLNRGRTNLRDLTTGPAKICQALRIDLSHNGISLCEPNQLWIELPERTLPAAQEDIAITPRIGISKAKELPLRFILKGNSFLSRPA